MDPTLYEVIPVLRRLSADPHTCSQFHSRFLEGAAVHLERLVCRVRALEELAGVRPGEVVPPPYESGDVKTKYDQNLVVQYSRWYHQSKGGFYLALGIAKCSTNGPRDQKEHSVIYWSDTYRALRYRDVREFLDGRFIPVGPDGKRVRFGADDRAPEIPYK